MRDITGNIYVAFYSVITKALPGATFLLTHALGSILTSI